MNYTVLALVYACCPWTIRVAGCVLGSNQDTWYTRYRSPACFIARISTMLTFYSDTRLKCSLCATLPDS